MAQRFHRFFFLSFFPLLLANRRLPVWRIFLERIIIGNSSSSQINGKILIWFCIRWCCNNYSKLSAGRRWRVVCACVFNHNQSQLVVPVDDAFIIFRSLTYQIYTLVFQSQVLE